MIKTVKNKRGFTLVEMMLSLAIITIIFGLTTALMVAIKDSFMTTVNTNDSADYGQLYAMGFEESLLRNTNNGDAGTWSIQDNLLKIDSTAVFTPTQLKTTTPSGARVDKWKIQMYFNVDSGGRVDYIVYVIDNYYDPGKLTYTYKGSLWLPHFSSTNDGELIEGGSEDPKNSGYYSSLQFKPV
ncbi:MAG: prepilin-type N-terminal cleavage/methylation domain-containing protein [Saccharofermentans sp.]|nr:prepilin-type N-terminal cleavage/methylation domain-containing protein [Saccharofermentans sp.]